MGVSSCRHSQTTQRPGQISYQRFFHLRSSVPPSQFISFVPFLTYDIYDSVQTEVCGYSTQPCYTCQSWLCCSLSASTSLSGVELLNGFLFEQRCEGLHTRQTNSTKSTPYIIPILLFISPVFTPSDKHLQPLKMTRLVVLLGLALGAAGIRVGGRSEVDNPDSEQYRQFAYDAMVKLGHKSNSEGLPGERDDGEDGRWVQACTPWCPSSSSPPPRRSSRASPTTSPSSPPSPPAASAPSFTALLLPPQPLQRAADPRSPGLSCGARPVPSRSPRTGALSGAASASGSSRGWGRRRWGSSTAPPSPRTRPSRRWGREPPLPWSDCKDGLPMIAKHNMHAMNEMRLSKPQRANHY